MFKQSSSTPMQGSNVCYVELTPHTSIRKGVMRWKQCWADRILRVFKFCYHFINKLCSKKSIPTLPRWLEQYDLSSGPNE